MVQPGFHFLIRSLADLFSPYFNVDDDVGDATGGGNDGEGEEGLVDVADHDAGIVAPV